MIDASALPNDIAFDAAGNAYVTDSMQATIWRVPPGGGAPTVWFQDSRLAAAYIGVNGIRLNPSRTKVLLTVTTDLTGQALVYTLPLAATGAEVFRLSNPVGSPLHPYDSPANIAFNGPGSILLTNHAFVTGVINPAQFTVLDVFVDDQESPLEKPVLP